MFSNYSIEELIEVLGNNGNYDLEMKTIHKIKQCVDENTIISYYPKYLFKNRDGFQYYLFTDYNIMIFSTKFQDYNEDEYNIRSVSKSLIIDLEMISNDYDVAILKIKLSTGEEIVFDNKIDTNQHHSKKYVKLINQIFKALIQ